MSRARGRLRYDLLAVALIVAAAVVLGLLQNSLLAQPLSLTGAAESSATSAPFKTPQDVRNAVAHEGAILIDSRETAQYEAGHLKGALSVPFSEREKRRRLQRLARRQAARVDGDGARDLGHG